MADSRERNGKNGKNGHLYFRPGMSSEQIVQLAVYDLSRGMAKQYLSGLLGISVEAIYHTGVRVYGYEYFYSDGIQKMRPDEVESRFGMQPIEVTPMGETEVPEEFADMFIEENRPRYTSESYDLLNHNCNNFSNEFVEFLTGNSIPEKIINLPQTLINTPQGKTIAPFLEQMGITKAIPLSTSSAQSNAVSSQSNAFSPQPAPEKTDAAVDTDSLSPWKHFKQELAISSLRQRSVGNPELIPLVKAVCLLHSKTLSNTPSFHTTDRCCAFLESHVMTKGEGPLLFDLLTVLTPSLPLLCAHLRDFGNHSVQLVARLLALFVRVARSSDCDACLRQQSLIALGAMCCPETQAMLWENKEVEALVQETVEMRSDDLLARFAKFCFLGNCCRVVSVSEEGKDASEEAMTILNALASTLFEEDNRDVLDLRLSGLYLLAKRGGALERITLQSCGVDEGSQLKIHDCDAKWEALVKLCSM